MHEGSAPVRLFQKVPDWRNLFVLPPGGSIGLETILLRSLSGAKQVAPRFKLIMTLPSTFIISAL